MDKTIQIILKAKDAMASGLSSAGNRLGGFAKSVFNVGKLLVGALIGAGTALAGFAAKALQAWSEQEAAENSMAAALRTHGEAAATLLPKMKQISSALQDETGASDDATLAGMARMRMLGVQTEQLELAAKGVIALKSAGMEEAAAQKAMAAALQGNYALLSKYLPALKLASTEQEKAAIVSDFVAKGYEVQKEKLNTLSGEYAMFKTRLGEIWEEIGRGIESNGFLSDAFDKVNDKLKAFAETISNWINSGGVVDYIADFRGGLENIGYGFVAVKNAVAVFNARLREGAPIFDNLYKVIRAWVTVAVVEFKYLANWAEWLWFKIREGASSAFPKPDNSQMLAAMRGLADAMVGMTRKETNILKDALKEQERDRLVHSIKMQSIEADRFNGYKKIEDARVKASKAANVAIVEDEEDAAGERVDIAEEAADKIEDIGQDTAKALERANDSLVPDERSVVANIVGVNKAGAKEVVSAWEAARKAQDAAQSSYSSISDFMNRPSIYESMGSFLDRGSGSTARRSVARAYATPTTNVAVQAAGSDVDKSILTELRLMRGDNKRLLVMG